MSTMQLRHYGAATYDPAKFRPVVDSQRMKPTGGLWTSPIETHYGWKEWCEAENFGNLSAWFDITFTGTVLVIDTEADLAQLPWVALGRHYALPLFQPLLLRGIDAVHLTEQGQEATRFSLPRNLYGWDCETVYVLNPRCLS